MKLWIAQTWRGMVETFDDCPGTVTAMVAFAVACAALGCFLWWPFYFVSFATVAALALAGYTHPLAMDDNGDKDYDPQ